MAEELEIHPLVGLPDGFIDPFGEKIVYDRDEDGEVIGWHKEAAE